MAPDPTPTTAQHECFDLDGTRVHGDPNMSDEARAALRTVIAATKDLIRSTCI